MRNSIFYYKELTPAEVGNTGTHEIYVRMPNNFEYEKFFKQSGVENGSVIEINFSALDITNGANDAEFEDIRFVYFANSNKEKRLPGLRPLFEKHNVKEGDIFFIESRTEKGNTSFIIKFYRKGSMIIQPSQIYFSKSFDEDSVVAKYYSRKVLDEPNQVIYFGAPGTGKSHTINTFTSALPEDNVFRTTFHPDSDYSTFVGSYKPTKEKRPVRNVAGDIVKQNGQEVYEEAITYNYIPQAFTKAYIRAWQTDEPVFLVIEEINRGNCAQIFGDLFQLLDRKDNKSEYPIKPDTDLGKFIRETFETEGHLAQMPAKVLSGEELCLPANLYIWATMNTSDQSLFPIDSAFKRRWEWRYIKMAKPTDKETGKPFDWHIEGDTDWWLFLKKINAIINKMTNSADKQLGYFFAKADAAGEIKYDRFVAKVCFYLWNDIFKTYAMDDVETDLFKFTYDEDGQTKTGKLNFTEFFDENGKVVPDIVKQFIENVMKWNDNTKQE